MSNRLRCLKVRNFRSLADVEVEIKAINILFGPNGAGKSTLLDAIWFVSDCAILGVDTASSERNHGIGALWDGADEGANISIQLETELVKYSVLFGYSLGRIEPFVGETLLSKSHDIPLINRKIGSYKADFYHTHLKKYQVQLTLRDPEKLALTRYLDFEGALEATELDTLLHSVHFYNSRSANLGRLKRFGSESSHHTHLTDRGQNLWSVLRNLHDRRSIDERFDTIMDFMRQGFPTFKDLFIQQTGPNTVYGNFVERELRNPIPAAGISDGYLQMLTLLTALFSEGKDHEALILFDEPEISLHPYALAVFARAVKLATEKWNKQIFIATHSPVLISQFDLENILAIGIDKSGQTIIERVSEMDEIKDLLDEYATGSLYMAEMIARQSRPVSEEQGV